MSAQVHEYVTKDGDRWDLLAWEFYADPGAVERITDANPHVPLYPVLPAGIRLVIPQDAALLETPIPSEELPPWKR